MANPPNPLTKKNVYLGPKLSFLPVTSNFIFSAIFTPFLLFFKLFNYYSMVFALGFYKTKTTSADFLSNSTILKKMLLTS